MLATVASEDFHTYTSLQVEVKKVSFNVEVGIWTPTFETQLIQKSTELSTFKIYYFFNAVRLHIDFDTKIELPCRY